ncbi:hypothetical protein [Flavobacterium sp. GNP001]
MKLLFTLAFVLSTISFYAQKNCEYSANVTDSIGTYKSTKEYLITEKNFGGNSDYFFFSLALTDNIPTLTLQQVQKSKDFLKVNCFDKNSKLYLQLASGKIITLHHIDQENCGTLIRDEKGFDNRVNSGTFFIIRNDFEDLKSSPVTMIRIKYLTSTEDYVLKKEFTSELTSQVYYPESYFINNIKCIE